MHIYAFGSVCRGDIGIDSDIDLLAIVGKYDDKISRDLFSIYSYQRIIELYTKGNPFAWHLHYEAQMIFSCDRSNFLENLGSPSRYLSYESDFTKFYKLFCSSKFTILRGSKSEIFDLSMIFLSIRNIATCFSLSFLRNPVFSRNSAMEIGEYSIDIDKNILRIFERARILCTRGIGGIITKDEVSTAISFLPDIEKWMISLPTQKDAL